MTLCQKPSDGVLAHRKASGTRVRVQRGWIKQEPPASPDLSPPQWDSFLKQ